MRAYVSALVAATFVVAGVVAPVHAVKDEGRWAPSFVGHSGRATLDLFGNGVGFASFGDAPLYKTRDFGETWTPINAPSGSATSEDLSFATPRTGYLTVGQGIERTTDGGATWQSTERLPTPPNYLAPQAAIDSLEALPGTDKLLVTGWAQAHSGDKCANRSNHGVWRSDNGGEDWKRITLPYPASTKESEFLDGRSGLVLVSVFKLEQKESSENACAGVIRTFRDAVLLTRDGGRTFDQIYSLRFSKSAPITAVAMASEHRILLGSSDGIIYRSDNGGRSFRRLKGPRDDGGLLPDGGIWELTFPTSDIGYAATATGLWRTEDCGRTWRKEESPFETNGSADIAAAGPTAAIAVDAHLIARRTPE